MFSILQLAYSFNHTYSTRKWLIIRENFCFKIKYTSKCNSPVSECYISYTKIRLFLYLQASMQLAGHNCCNRCIRSIVTFTRPIKAFEKYSLLPVIATISVNSGKSLRKFRYYCKV